MKSDTFMAPLPSADHASGVTSAVNPALSAFATASLSFVSLARSAFSSAALSCAEAAPAASTNNATPATIDLICLLLASLRGCQEIFELRVERDVGKRADDHRPFE